MTDDFEDAIRDRATRKDAFSEERVQVGSREAVVLVPNDDHAVYGYPNLGDREPPTDVPLYRDAGALADAIRTVDAGDEVRVNDGRFYPAVETENSVVSEGFVYETPRGVRREVSPTNPTNRPQGTFDSPWIRKLSDYSSEGELHVLEVKWEGRS
jgi:hypothetical protein